MNDCEKCPWLYNNNTEDNEDWGCYLFGKECGGKLVDDEENGTYGCIFSQKVLQRLAHKLNKKLERLAKIDSADNGIFSGFKFYKFLPGNLVAVKPPMKGGHHHRRNYSQCSQCAKWFRNNKGEHGVIEKLRVRVHFCSRLCSEAASYEVDRETGWPYEPHHVTEDDIIKEAE